MGVRLHRVFLLLCIWITCSHCCAEATLDSHDTRTAEEADVEPDKRAPALSINQPLVSLASSIRGRHKPSKNTLAWLGKRPAMSFTNDLNALAGKVRYGKTAYAQNKLGFLGKRNPSFENEGLSVSDNIQEANSLGEDKRSQDGISNIKRAVSVNQPLVALADMVHAGKAGSTLSRLHGLGKRVPALSVNQPLVALSNMMAGGRTSSSLSRLHGLGKKRSQDSSDQFQGDAWSEGGESTDGDSLISAGKRRSISVNQDLVALAGKVNGFTGSGASHARLLSLGKRDDSDSKTTLYDVVGAEEYEENTNGIHDVDKREAGSDDMNKEWDFADEDDGILAEKRPAVSINQDLMTLADMVRSRNGGPGTSRLLSLGKRPAMSINNDLMTLANMMNGFRSAGSRSRLMSLGKRRDMSINADLMAIADSLRSRHNKGSMRLYHLGKRNSDVGDFSGEPTEDVFRKRRGAVSINVPLETISQMVSAERRRQYQARASDSRNRLHGIGKRSTESREIVYQGKSD